jgi:hypothetical protein
LRPTAAVLVGRNCFIAAPDAGTREGSFAGLARAVNSGNCLKDQAI